MSLLNGCHFLFRFSEMSRLHKLSDSLQIWHIIVKCEKALFYRDGAGRTGAFCAVCASIDQTKAESLVDIFQVVKSMRSQRPQVVRLHVLTRRPMTCGLCNLIDFTTWKMSTKDSAFIWSIEAHTAQNAPVRPEPSL